MVLGVDGGSAAARALVGFGLSGLWACARPPPAVRPDADPERWAEVRQALDVERAARPKRSWAAGLVMTMRAPRAGRTVDGRGAIAVAPGRALRIILVGVAGATMLDAWVTPDRWRIAVPPVDSIRRGGLDEPRELPVGFLRWLFFRPLAGTLFGGSTSGDRPLFLLRDGDATFEVRLGRCDRGNLTTTTRRAPGQSERLEECRASGAVGAAAPGDWVRYEHEGTGLQVELAIESLANEPPAEAAFVDPDTESAPGGGVR
jgi:hypothetical protein